MKVYIGTCGNKVGLKKYVELFDTLEINATFYNFPSETTLKNWEKVFKERKDFKLAFKAFQGLTHPLGSPTWRRAKLTPEEKERFRGRVGCLKLNPVTEALLERILEMATRLSARFLLFQLPRNCEREKEGFAHFFSRLRELSGGSAGLHFGLEIRWYEADLLVRVCEDFGIVPVFDPLLFPKYLDCFKDLPLLYFRLHGTLEGGRLNYNKRYSDDELRELGELLSGLRANEVFVLFNNIYMHQDALRFREIFLTLSNKETPQ
ncbi:DUF72 domain-containing protein [Thermosulfurimonas dismutans]|uniref:DUF72 domain-containing protein n=1 Tax=Thermosulfurimonas dismutans TaxID=999894 RepID=A0A179D249_9BACT|nr:DUF72 domain-containing protein [Thermosulfurimonas dismutans]OAQ20120.1 hypothetical protein TDIS_1746 [Thermosulfurimonas dismutans]